MLPSRWIEDLTDEDAQALADRVFKARPLTVPDLPVASLQRKLEMTWQPDAGVLLEPGSIGIGSLGDSARSHFGILTSNQGSALSSVSTATSSSYTDWGASGPKLIIPEAGDWFIETGAILVQQQTANLTEGRFCVAINGTPIGGSSVAHIAALQFAGATMIGRAPKTTCAAGDVLTLRYATNAQPVSYGGVGTVVIFARRAS